MSEYLLIENAEVGKSVAVFPDTVPFDVASLNEPMAVARHAVNRSEAGPADKVVVFGAGPIGLGAAIWLKLRGVEHVVVADVIPDRLETALAVGADAVINSATEDVTGAPDRTARPGRQRPRAAPPGTDIYIDAAGAPGGLQDRGGHRAKWGAKLVMVAVQKKGPTPSTSAACSAASSPSSPPRATRPRSSRSRPNSWSTRSGSPSSSATACRFADVDHAFELALTPGAAEKIVVTFDGQDRADQGGMHRTH